MTSNSHRCVSILTFIVVIDCCVTGLRRLAESSDQSVSKEAKGALWILEGRNKQEAANTNVTATSHSTTSSQQHIMLSYPWFYQSVATDVCRRLREHGYKVWMDIDDMSKNFNFHRAHSVKSFSIKFAAHCMLRKLRTGKTVYLPQVAMC